MTYKSSCSDNATTNEASLHCALVDCQQSPRHVYDSSALDTPSDTSPDTSIHPTPCDADDFCDLDTYYMQRALAQAQKAALEQEVPIGAVVVCNNTILSAAHNLRQHSHNPSDHAEFIAMLQAAKKLDSWHLERCCVYVTLEPCLMCAGLMLNARIARCVFGAYDQKAGACGSLYNVSNDFRLNHSFELKGGVLADESANLLQQFFKHKRAHA
ncbi:tRNA adenosine(34) deaminase TadA [Fannyhessea vaginae]|uniref:tRNA adenosine(34) deaminase TadA n=1 Tax=Fannyhessea vaginae TaxID=82135 RepID=UPI0028895ED0|nr:tRNA adenosine(34) deaminase TadA [Fannyhessea vaginae]